MMIACGALALSFTGAGAAVIVSLEFETMESPSAWHTETKLCGGPNLKGLSPKLKAISAF